MWSWSKLSVLCPTLVAVGGRGRSSSLSSSPPPLLLRHFTTSQLADMTARVTRSSTKAQSATESLPPPASPSKRPRPTSGSGSTESSSAPAPPSTPKSKRAKQQHKPTPDSPYVPPTPNTQRQIEDEAHEADEAGEKEGAVLLHPPLRFKYEDAKKHIIATDKRWAAVFGAMPCKPFEGEQTEAFNPFRTLVSSILGAQISWLAARAIQHKFCRLFFPHLPEKLAPPAAGGPKLDSPFPTPRMVLDLPDRFASLRGAGLSGRKVEYVVELAERFSDGRLEARKLWAMEDKELTEVRPARSLPHSEPALTPAVTDAHRYSRRRPLDRAYGLDLCHEAGRHPPRRRPRCVPPPLLSSSTSLSCSH